MILTCRRNVFLVIAIFAINSLVAVSLNADKQFTLKQFLKNQTKARNNGDGNKDNDEKENVLRTEAWKLLKQCDGERNRYGDDTNNKFSASKGENNINNFRPDRQSNGYGNDNNESSGNSWSSNRNGTTYGSQNNENEEWNMFRSPKRYDTGSNTAESSYGTQHFNQANNENKNPYNSNNMNYQTDHRSPSNIYSSMPINGDQLNRPNTDYRSRFNENSQSSGFGESTTGYQAGSSNAFDMRNSYGPNSDGFHRVTSSDNDCRDNVDRNCGKNMFVSEYNSGITFGSQIPSHRNKRYNYFNKEDKDRSERSQCVSQCIFEYLRLLDYDKTPSETLLIKWLQEHVTGNDMDRIKELRKARSCFSKLTASDTDDGCEMTTELSKCLELELE
ncbi:hypothetical protein HUJ04_012835 [Dendroctonus ponderosae]|uniref:Uncharacterized protein n=1 Tax=Dendroctonus ponderosae TaxID=77166 RepID=A0AAR5PJ82_DENPD|nr:hypothetical protein HUJ04_012835 [Dendroctonus ponderosae]